MATETKSKGKGITKRVGPLPVWGYGAVGVGAFLIFRLLKSRSKGGTASAANIPLSGGIGIPAGQSGVGPQTFASFGGWQQAAIAAMAGGVLSPADALNGLTSWINGQCVTAGQYNGISSIITTVGLPPGFSSVPTLSVCPAPTAAAAPAAAAPAAAASAAPAAPAAPVNPGNPPNLSQTLIAAMTANGEHLVSGPVWDSVANEWLYLTQKGGVYTIDPTGANGSQFYGSGLSSSLGGAFSGRTARGITANPNGGYTITDSLGSNYTFGPGAGQNYAGANVQ